MRDPVCDQALLERLVPLGALALLRAVGMELHAPATGEHARVPLDESDEVAECLRRERLDREVRHGGSACRTRSGVTTGVEDTSVCLNNFLMQNS